jgi:hypothetical protein
VRPVWRAYDDLCVGADAEPRRAVSSSRLGSSSRMRRPHLSVDVRELVLHRDTSGELFEALHLLDQLLEVVGVDLVGHRSEKSGSTLGHARKHSENRPVQASQARAGVYFTDRELDPRLVAEP